MRAVVVALGKMGLPIAVQLAAKGHDVVGCDIDERTVGLVNEGVPPFPGEAHLDVLLAEAVRAGKLRAQTDTTAAVAEAPDLVVAVPPLYVDEHAKPAWGALDAATEAIGAGLQRGTTVVLETTVPVGTTRNRMAPRLELASGLKTEVDFFTAFSPERVSSGRVFRDLATYPKLVGGLSTQGEQRASELYAQFLDAEVWAMAGAEAAELTKLAETTYRDLNIAYANELAKASEQHGVDVEHVITAANSQPFSHIHRPGVYVGGHCIPVYPRFFLEGAPDAQLPRVARDINESMPAHAVDLLGDVRGQTVLVLGVAYRGGVKEHAFSGATRLRDVLADRGAVPVFADPLYSDEELRALGYEPWDRSRADAAIVQADHEEYKELAPDDLPGVTRIVDGRGVLDVARFDGIPVKRIGR